MHHIAVDNVDKFSLSDAMPVCSTLHSPAPISDTALTLTVYSLPASSPVRRVEVTGGEPEMAGALFQEVVPLLLYSTWYWEMATSLWGEVQVTLRASEWDSTVLIKVILLTLEGAVQEVIKGSIPLKVYCREFRCASAANTAKRLMCRCRINDTPIYFWNNINAPQACSYTL